MSGLAITLSVQTHENFLHYSILIVIIVTFIIKIVTPIFSNSFHWSFIYFIWLLYQHFQICFIGLLITLLDLKLKLFHLINLNMLPIIAWVSYSGKISVKPLRSWAKYAWNRPDRLIRKLPGSGIRGSSHQNRL